ncbi:MAG: O-antigen ligase family protein [Bacteroidetes bacterium]|nr:O-antigen ligase family protein [Bacteroidota bacterium]MBU1720938.1 O-antigen ligase family protein [Bacteroidota bacterium]
MKTWFPKVLFCYLPLLLIPIVYTTNTLDANLQIRFILLATFSVVLSGYFLYRLSKKEVFPFQKLIREKYIILYFLYLIMSSTGLLIYSVNMADGMFDWFKIALGGIILLLLILIFEKHSDFFRHFARAMVLLGAISCTIALIQLGNIMLNETITHSVLYNMSATFGHKNILSEFLLLFVAFGFFGFLHDKKIWKPAGAIVAFLSLLLLISSMTRAVWVAFAVASLSTAIVFFISIRKRKGRRRIFNKRFLLISAALVSVFALSIFFYSRLDSISTFQKQLQKTTNLKQGSANERIMLWKNTARLATEHPLTGYGLGSWRIEILKFGKKGMENNNNLTFYQRPHNDFLWVAMEQGIPALLIYLLLAALLLRYMLKIVLTSDNQEKRDFFLMMFFGYIGYLVFSCFSFPKERIEHILVQSFAVSLVLIERTRGKATAPSGKCKGYIPGVIFIAIGGFSIFAGCERIQSEIHTFRAFEQRERLNWKGVITEIDKTNPAFYIIDATSTPLLWYRGMANFNLNHFEEATKDFENAFRINPNHIHVLNNLGTCYEKSGEHKKALEKFEKAVEISPVFYEAWLNICAIKFNAGDIDGAYNAVIQAKNDSTQGRYLPYLKAVMQAKGH